MEPRNLWTIILVLLYASIIAGGFLPRVPAAPKPAPQEFQLVTGEWKWASSDGTQEIEAYRWDPAVIVVLKGTAVTLKIFGVNGSHHTLVIKEYGVMVPVTRGETSSIAFKADKTGTFEILCTDHPDPEQNGPMIGYLVVL